MAEKITSSKVSQRLATLLGQHAILTSQLRALQSHFSNTETQINIWSNAAPEVIRLRCETEALNKTFATFKCVDNRLVSDDLLEI